MGLGRVKTKSDLVAMPVAEDKFLRFSALRMTRRAQNLPGAVIPPRVFTQPGSNQRRFEHAPDISALPPIPDVSLFAANDVQGRRRHCARRGSEWRTAADKALKMPRPHKVRNRSERIRWLRAAVLGANDGIVSTASLVLGVAAAHGTRSNVFGAAVAGLVAGAMAMAAGAYVSVHSQADTEHIELKRERAELKADDKAEHEELMAIHVDRGLDPPLAKQVAEQPMAHDTLGAHARDELDISETLHARPIQAALASAPQLHRWSGRASFGDSHLPDVEFDCRGPWNITGVPRTFGCIGCGRKRGKCDGGRNTRNILGYVGFSSDRERGGRVRNNSMNGAARTMRLRLVL